MRLVSTYVEQLVFSQDNTGHFNLPPFDVFLARNRFPHKPAENESASTIAAPSHARRWSRTDWGRAIHIQ